MDLHVDLSYQAEFKGRTLRSGAGQYRAEWLQQAVIEAVVFPLYIPRDVSPQGPQLEHLERSYRSLLEKLPGIEPYTTRTCQSPRAGVEAFVAFEGAAPLGHDLDSVWRWARRGVRLYGLVHSYDNLLASSAGYGYTPREARRGLSPTGKELVRRIHATGGMVDVSHASDATFDDVVRRATADAVPVVATHSNARALAPHTRNLSDAQLRAIGTSGGVVGVNFHAPFLLGGPGDADIDDVVRHVRHIARVAGIDSVAIGSDFEGGIRPPRRLGDVRGFPRLAEALLESGFRSNEVRKIFGDNARRVLCRNREHEP